jgi:putative ABC transport system permease protein
MIKSLLLVAMRNFKKDRWYSMLNILGLSISIAFSLFLIFYVKDELSYDRYNKKADRIYRITSFSTKFPEKEVMKWAITQFPLGPVLKKDYPEVEEAVRFVGMGKTIYKNGSSLFYEDKVFASDSNTFNVFTYQFIEGNPQTALVAPNSMVLTKSMAEKYFGKNQNIIGKTLQNDKGDIYKITAIVKDVPRNSHIIYHALISMSSLPKDFGDDWGGFGTCYTYVLLKPKTNAKAFEKKLLVLYDKYMASIFAQFNIKIHYGVQPVTDIHLCSDLVNEPEELGSVSYIYIFSAVALFMLLIACINYMNLMTARSAQRAKEIGIRKVMGSSKTQLVTQFLFESTLTALIALLLGIVFIQLLLPTFNLMAGKFISFETLLEQDTALILLVIILWVGLLGGSYPAFYLSKFKPVSVLKGNLSKSSSNIILRKVLVTLQFSISLTMLICTWVVYGQLKYLQDKDLGFNKDRVLSLNANTKNDIRGQSLDFKNKLRNNPHILSVSTAQAVPGSRANFDLYKVESKNGFIDKVVENYRVDEDYLKTLGMHINKGRNFSGLSDTLRSIIVNENMVKYFGWDNAIGKRVKWSGDTSGFYYEVVGVIKDFNQNSLYNPITPLILFYKPTNNTIILKLDPKNIPTTIASVEKLWKITFPDLPYTYTFLDQDFNSQYMADQKRGRIFTAFSILTIFITCLGLLGLIAFTTEQRKKEISIRKVMGAGIAQIIPLITGNFALLLLLSCLLAFPIAYLFMDKWLKLFSYNTGLTIIPFLFSAGTLFLIVSLTVSFHVIKAAIENPVRNLRTE